MTRSRGLLYSLLGISAVGLALATGAFFTGSARAAVGPLPSEGLALPSDSSFVMGLDVKRFVASPFYTRYASKDAKARPEAFRDLEARTGLNPERDVDQIIIAGSHANKAGAAIVFGRFDRTRVQQAVESTHKGKATWKNQSGTTIYLFDEGKKSAGAMAFLGDNVLVLGSQTSVESVAANHASGGKGIASNAPLMKLVEGVKPGSTFWMAGDQSLLASLDTGFGRHHPAGGSGLEPAAISADAAVRALQAGPAGPWQSPLAGLPPLKSIVVTGDLDPIVSFQAAGEVADEAAAKNLADVIRGFLALAALQAQQKPELKELSTAVSVTQDAQRVLVNGRFPYELIDSLQPRKAAAPAAKPTAE
jgi:hypothetical protein